MNTTRVLVVGAGPTGLLLGAELHRRGIACRIVDAHAAPLGWDRATIVHARSLEVFESIGLVDRLLDEGIRLRATRLYSDGSLLGELDVSGSGSRYGFDLSVPEEVTERLLTTHAADQGGVIERSTVLVGFEQDDDGVAVALDTPGGTESLRVDWLVGCDGYHSTTRATAGIAFPGHDYPVEWAVFDGAIDGWSGPADRTSSYLEPTAVILVPLPGRRWRLYLHPTSPTSDPVTDAEDLLRTYAPGAAIRDVTESGRFKTHSRVAARYRAGRVVLAGDAAHVCSPAEGHGMNTGLHDAHNLAWKLALVCRGHAAPTLLDSYECERRPVAEQVARSGDKVEAGKAITEPDARARRDRVLRCRLTDPELQHAQTVAAAELDASYGASPIVAGDRNAALGPGDRLPETDPVRAAGGRWRALHELTHRCEHTVLVLGRDFGAVASATAAAAAVGAESPAVDSVVGLAPGGTVASERSRRRPSTASESTSSRPSSCGPTGSSASAPMAAPPTRSRGTCRVPSSAAEWFVDLRRGSPAFR